MALVIGKVGGEMIKEREELRLDSIWMKMRTGWHSRGRSRRGHFRSHQKVSKRKDTLPVYQMLLRSQEC